MIRRQFLHSLGLGCAALGVACTTNQRKSGAGSKALDVWHAALAEARAHRIARLGEYREARRYPYNHRVLGRVPVFVDEAGTRCAVGHLMLTSGHDQLVADIAGRDNNVYIESITEGPALDWIRFSGLTQDECALIQPHYDHMWPIRLSGPDEERLYAHFVAVEQQLVRATPASLATALAVLEPAIERGASLDRVVA